MTNNDILRRLRYAFDFDDTSMIAVFAEADHQVTREQVCNWLKQEDDSEYAELADRDMALFLNGLINLKRGRREGAQPEPEQQLTNNMIFMKLKIALDLKSEDTLAILKLADCPISRHELTAFFRKPGHKHYRECKDQIMRNFLQGLQLKCRGESEAVTESPWRVPRSTSG
ncbi:DUF1456 domain-containing protein [Kineobactrum sediminis]|uniref:DUF1456 domain-containing protein n=1 Tax=Kineobactrum sediminis TaxID=1905677 RepID=A0A2N5Y185_9GAMM|nr:DUF1456 family protein [Kineobactrum sediminis]PLW82157.1 DUF1456 domain-containing protein [Kineobactrum sediminis]